MKSRVKVRIACILTVFAVFLLKSVNSFALEKAEETDNIVAFFDSIGTNWDSAYKYVTEELVPDYQYFAKNYENSHVGIMNVRNADIFEMVQVDFLDIEDSMSYYDYSDTDTFYVVGVNYDVFEDSVYFSKGITYAIIACKLQEGQWKVADYRNIYKPERLLECGYQFDKEKYQIQIDKTKYAFQGFFVNGIGELYEDVDGNRYDNVNFLEYCKANGIDN